MFFIIYDLKSGENLYVVGKMQKLEIKDLSKLKIVLRELTIIGLYLQNVKPYVYYK